MAQQTPTAGEGAGNERAGEAEKSGQMCLSFHKHTHTHRPVSLLQGDYKRCAGPQLNGGGVGGIHGAPHSRAWSVIAQLIVISWVEGDTCRLYGLVIPMWFSLRHSFFRLQYDRLLI